MCDPEKGDRTGEWFWRMILSLGLEDMKNAEFSIHYIHSRIDVFLNRTYMRNGKGGLFTVPRCKYDMRTVEIWDQLMLYLNYIADL